MRPAARPDPRSLWALMVSPRDRSEVGTRERTANMTNEFEDYPVLLHIVLVITRKQHRDGMLSLADRLRQHDMVVDVTSGADDTFDAIEKIRPDAVIWKSSMFPPGPRECDSEDYIRFARQIRSQRKYDRLPLFLIGSFERHHEELVRRGRAAGFNMEINDLAIDPVQVRRLIEEQKSLIETKPKLLFLEPDTHQALPFVRAFADVGFQVTRTKTVATTLEALDSKAFQGAVLDVMVPPGSSFSALETEGGFKTGLALGHRIREKNQNLPIVALTHSSDPEVSRWFSRDNALYLQKHSTSPTQAARLIKRFLRLPAAPLNVFVVHGRNTNARSELCTYIRDDLCVGAPIVLEEQPSAGMTIIEKFEYYGHEADIVFALLTPDDVGGLFGSSPAEEPRARQNVIFELGYFLGFLRRSAARVVLLKSGDLGLPSDIHGVVYVDVSAGIRAADAAIRRELRVWL